MFAQVGALRVAIARIQAASPPSGFGTAATPAEPLHHSKIMWQALPPGEPDRGDGDGA